jgi:hypothetical protein
MRLQSRKMNKLPGMITLSSRIQMRVALKGQVDSLKGTVVWEYESLVYLRW